jgi:hypothetical protein
MAETSEDANDEAFCTSSVAVPGPQTPEIFRAISSAGASQRLWPIALTPKKMRTMANMPKRLRTRGFISRELYSGIAAVLSEFDVQVIVLA